MDWNRIDAIITKWGTPERDEWRRLFDKWDGHHWHDRDRPNEKTNVLLVDASLVTTDGRPDMGALYEFLESQVQASVSDLYLVSLFPYIGRQTDTAVDPRIRLYEDLGHFADDFGLMYDLDPVIFNERQFDVLAETNALIERLAYGATKIRVHARSFRGMTTEQVKDVLALWHEVLHHYKPNGQLILADDAMDDAHPFFKEVDAICHFDLASHIILAFAQGDATRLVNRVRKIDAPPEGKTYFNFLSTAERDPFEKNLVEAPPEAILAAHSILFSLQGIPSLDYRTVFGVTGPTDRDTLVHALKTDGERLKLFSGVLSQANVKRVQRALSPYASQRVLDTDTRLFAIERKMEGETIHLYTNVSADEVELHVEGTSLFTGEPVDAVTLPPYGYIWLEI
ncbi:hypothetical protein [Exiguobacterium algae]|uniref:hypothetical protein n=1 Tax=Exiguobacterium algae TaxID=2751250 RepID=UPI001BEB0EE7|nr:hypothetical protein [Exiguobacterium algae]